MAMRSIPRKRRSYIHNPLRVAIEFLKSGAKSLWGNVRRHRVEPSRSRRALWVLSPMRPSIIQGCSPSCSPGCSLSLILSRLLFNFVPLPVAFFDLLSAVIPVSLIVPFTSDGAGNGQPTNTTQGFHAKRS